MNQLRICFDGFPFDDSRHGGPKVFMRRLGRDIASRDSVVLKAPINPFYDIGLFSVKRKNYYPKPYVLRLDGLGKESGMYQAQYKSAQKASGIVFLTDYCRRVYEQHFEPVSCPYTIVHNKVDIGIFHPNGPNQRERLGISNDCRVMIASSHWRRWKRLREISELFVNAKRKAGHPLKLIVLGGKPDHIIDDPDVIYAGEIQPDALAPWYRTADVYVHLARIEPCGNTQIEAMACGVPVLCIDNGGGSGNCSRCIRGHSQRRRSVYGR
jgi:glycosyltransferase involved in cell wall biosynthesis